MKNKVLVCITAQTNSKRLIDKGHSVANNYAGELHILHVEKGDNVIFSSESVELLQELFIYASELGGIVHGLSGDNVYNTIKKFIKEESITKIVIGSTKDMLIYSKNSIFYKLQVDFPYIELFILPRKN